MQKKILIVGASGHAKVIVDIVEREGRCVIMGILDRKLPAGSLFQGYEIVGRDDEAEKFSSTCDGAIIAIGDNYVRSLVAEKVGKHLPFETAIHPTAVVARGVAIGQGTVVMARAVVNPGCEVGTHCILNTAASLDHDSTLGDYASLAPGVVTGGNCHVGTFSAVSIGAILKHGVSIGPDSVVGAGSLVLTDIEANVVAYGSPARIVRMRSRGDKYL